MIIFLKDADVTLTTLLEQGGEPFVADGNSVDVEIRGTDGAILRARTATPSPDSRLLVSVPAALNTIAADKLFEKRTVVIYGALNGATFIRPISYMLTGLLNLLSGPQEVRAFIGIDEGELQDQDIDIFAAYADVVSLSTKSAVDTALIGGDYSEIQANRAIIAKAVLNLIPSMQARISKVSADGTTSITRFPVDLAELADRAKSVLDAALTDITKRQVVNVTGFIVGASRTDPVTGA